jgi:hypothetical protein
MHLPCKKLCHTLNLNIPAHCLKFTNSSLHCKLWVTGINLNAALTSPVNLEGGGGTGGVVLSCLLYSTLSKCSWKFYKISFKNKLSYSIKNRSQYSDRLRAWRPRGQSSSPGRVKNFHFSTSSRPALGSTKPPRGLSGRGVKLTIHLELVPRTRKCGSIHPLPHTPSWHNA